MLNLPQIKKFLVYSLVSLCFNTCPVLAQGEKVLSLDQVAKTGEIVVIVGSTLFAIGTLISLFLTSLESISVDPSSLDLTILLAFIGLFLTLGGSLVVGQLTYDLVIALKVNLGIFLSVLIIRVIYPAA